LETERRKRRFIEERQSLERKGKFLGRMQRNAQGIASFADFSSAALATSKAKLMNLGS
jgi:hypothetical protein